MATKKKAHKKKGHHRRRRVSGTAQIQEFAMRVLGIGAGAVGGAFLINAGKTALQSQNLPLWAIPSVVGAAGLGLPYLVKRNALAEDVGAGMFAVGALMVANETFINVPGIAGMSMTSNTPNAKVMQQSVGCAGQKMGQGPGNYLNKTVNGHTRAMAVGALYSN